ncbi:uncharacterized protein [Dermacentor albipictus]|uniref:uncharacterized protein isoform X2 n=1 Tax=Dermacentor albipictus TaxID=60249 RepID=UPI0038FC7478
MVGVLPKRGGPIPSLSTGCHDSQQAPKFSNYGVPVLTSAAHAESDSASQHSRRMWSTVSLSPHLPQVGGSLPRSF